MEIFIYLMIVAQICLLIGFRNLKSSIRKAQSKSHNTDHKNEKLLHSLNLCFESLTKNRELPPPLMNVPFADESGIVLSVKKIEIPSIPAPYNASIGATADRNILFFRYDEPNLHNERAEISSNIGCISLDQKFDLLEKEYSKIDTNSSYSEDARFFQEGDRCFLIYNDVTPHFGNQRCIHIGAIDVNKKRLEYITPLNLNSKKTEKNWTPFSHKGEIHFLYTINPQKILILPNPNKNLLRPHRSAYLTQSPLAWPDKWGILRGGTPAKLVGEEYLAFFHSSFEDAKGIIWYIMGAYTFAAFSPFKITRISPHPILFKNIYDTPHHMIANPKIRAIYPSGFILQERSGKELIHLSCGENDSGIKIISIDKNALLASLKPVHLSKNS
jgi:predicted GH43/DUF377 family glycosyl hydrolase